MQILSDPYNRIYVRVGHRTWDIKLTDKDIWFQQVEQPEETYTDITGMNSATSGITCDGYMEEILTTLEVTDFNASMYLGVTKLGIGTSAHEQWYPEQFRITSRWMPAITIGKNTYELSTAYGDTIRVVNIGAEKASELKVKHILLGTSGRVLLPLGMIPVIHDSKLNEKRVSIPWQLCLNGLEAPK